MTPWVTSYAIRYTEWAGSREKMALRLTNVNLQRPNSQCTFESLKNLLLYKKKAVVGSQSFNNNCTSVSLPQHL